MANTPWNINLFYKRNNVDLVKVVNLSLNDLKSTLLKVKEENKEVDKKWATPIIPLIREHIMDKLVNEGIADITTSVTIKANNNLFTRLKEGNYASSKKEGPV